MIKTKHLLVIFIPAIFFGLLFLFVRVIQYQPLYPSQAEYDKLKANFEFAIPLDTNDPILGEKKSPITIVAFVDYACLACQEQVVILEQLIIKHPEKIKVILKVLPVTKFPYSTELANEYGFCLNQQNKFAEFYPLAFMNGNSLNQELLQTISTQIEADPERLNNCLTSGAGKIYNQNNEQIGLALNIQSVPTFFLNNKQITAPRFLEGWETLLKL